jgi:tetratricopeptide (TPR) repeat protein
MCRREKQLNGRPLLDSLERKSRIQLALCHRLGFGGAVPADSKLLHEHFGEIASDVDRLIDEIRNVPIKTFTGNIVLQSVQSGSFPAIGTGEQYGTLSLLTEAEKRIKSEADALKSSLGKRPPNVPRLLLELALGSINMAQGRLKRAAVWLEVAGDTSCELFGLANSHTLTIVGNIATVYRDLKDYKKAERFFNCQLKGEQILYKPDNHRLLNTMMNIAALYIDQGKSHEAEELLEKILHKKKTSLGIGHEDTLAAMTNLAIAYRNQSRWKKAEDIEIQVLEIRKSFSPPHHPEVLTARNNLSHTYKGQNRWDDALAIDEAVYKLRKRHLGSYHHATLASMANLARVYHHMNFWDKALKLSLEVLFLLTKIRGKDHIDTISVKITVARFCLDREQNREALEMSGAGELRPGEQWWGQEPWIKE